jgi:predicted negative regulator of RcsB-dependent stress response
MNGRGVLWYYLKFAKIDSSREGTMGTTKLTRKEILAEDPVHVALVRMLDILRHRGQLIALALVSVILLAVGVTLGLQYLKSRDLRAQQELSKAMSFYHARLDPAAPDDPFGKGALEPLFRTEAAKYQAAAKEFNSIISKQGSSKIGIIARYYLGLSQLQLGQKEEAVRSLETVRNNTKDLTLGYLAKKVLAKHYMDAGNFKASQEILEGMIKDPQCELPKEDLKLELSRVYVAQGKRDDALKVLREARDQGDAGMLRSMVTQELAKLEAQ